MDNNETRFEEKRLSAFEKEPSEKAQKDRSQGSESYSRFIRRMRVVLPLFAVILLVLIITWPKQDDVVQKTSPLETSSKQTIAKNELVNPKFESRDRKGQPYTVIAEKAIQAAEDENLLILQKPEADFQLNNGENVKITSETGSYQQETEDLILQKNIIMTHSAGYKMFTEELHSNLINNQVWTKTEVRIDGKAGTIDAKGLQANAADNRLIFSGPAKMVLYSGGDLLGSAFQVGGL